MKEYPHRTYLIYKKIIRSEKKFEQGLQKALRHWRWMQEQDADRELELRIQEKFKEFW